jgi:hypothetical protein
MNIPHLFGGLKHFLDSGFMLIFETGITMQPAVFATFVTSSAVAAVLTRSVGHGRILSAWL